MNISSSSLPTISAMRMCCSIRSTRRKSPRRTSTGWLTDHFGHEAVAFIDRQKNKPFFLYLAFNAVQAPLQAPADEIAKFNTGNKDRNTLLAMGKRMDDAIGNVVAKLKREGAYFENA